MSAQSLMEKLKADYRFIERYMCGIEDATNVVDIQTQIRKLKGVLENHFRAEEMSVYPRCLESQNENLEEMVRLGERDHTTIRQKVWSLGSPKVNNLDWDEKVRSLKARIEDYTLREDRSLLPLLSQVFDEGQLEKIRTEYLAKPKSKAAHAA